MCVFAVEIYSVRDMACEKIYCANIEPNNVVLPDVLINAKLTI